MEESIAVLSSTLYSQECLTDTGGRVGDPVCTGLDHAKPYVLMLRGTGGSGGGEGNEGQIVRTKG